MKQPIHLNSIQTLRALAAWMVVFHHFMQVFYNFQNDSWFGKFFILYGSLGVDIFFIISGFVIYISTADKKISPLNFFLNRLVRIAPAYWFFTLITSTILCYSPSILPFTLFEPLFLLKCILFIPGINPFGVGFLPILTVGWTLNYEMAFYLIFSVALGFRHSRRILSVTVGLLVLNLILPKMGGAFDFYNNSIVYEFFIGILIGVFWRKNYMHYIQPKAAFILVIIALVTLRRYSPSHDFLRIGLPCGLLVCAFLSQERLFKNSVITHLGNWSYSTYLCHVLILCFAYQATNRWQLNIPLVLSVSCVLILLVSYLSFTYLEKPILKLAKQYINKKKPPKLSLKEDWLPN